MSLDEQLDLIEAGAKAKRQLVQKLANAPDFVDELCKQKLYYMNALLEFEREGGEAQALVTADHIFDVIIEAVKIRETTKDKKGFSA